MVAHGESDDECVQERDGVKILLDGLQAGNLSGTGRYTEELIKGLPSVNEHVDLHVFLPETADAEALGLDEDHVIRVNTKKVLGGSRYRDKKIVNDLKRLQPDIVHYTATIGSIAKRKKWDRSKVIVTVHDLAFMRNPEWFKRSRAVYYQKKIRGTVDNADRLIADSCSTADDLMLFLDQEQENIDVVPLGVDESFKETSEEEQARVRKKYNLPERFFLYVGTIEPRKNIEGIVSGFSNIANRVPQDLVIAGRDGWKVKPIYKAVKDSGFQDRIHFPGFIEQEDLPGVHSAADVFVWPSFWEGFGLPLLEAMACGTPIVTSDVSSIPEVVGHASATVDPYSPETIGRAMKNFALEDSLRLGYVTSGLNRVKDFPWSLCVEMTYDSYERALDGVNY